MKTILNNTIILFILLQIIIMNCSNNLNSFNEYKDLPGLKCKEKDIPVLQNIASDAGISLKRLMVYDDIEFFYKDYRNAKDGIFLNSVGNITALRLRNTKFSNLKLLKALTELERIDLSNNRILKIDGLDNLHKLKSLNLSDNKISKLEGLDNLYELKGIDLSNNKILKLEGLDNLHELKYLHTRKNNITEIENLESLNSLDSLDIAMNKISGTVKFKGLNKLRVLFIYRNNIDAIEFNGLKNLRWIMARWNKITEIKNIRVSSKLSDLDIYGNPIYDIEGIESLKRLKNVYIGREYDEDYYAKADPLIEKLKKMKVKVITAPDVHIEPDPDVYE